MKRHIVLVGPLQVGRQSVGGTEISFAQLVGYFLDRSEAWSTTVVSTSRDRLNRSFLVRSTKAVWAFVGVFVSLARSGPKADLVMLNLSPGGLLSGGPILWLLLRAMGKPVVIRVFGGDLDLFLGRLSLWRRRLIDATVLRSPLSVQTRMLQKALQDRYTVEWLPTARDVVEPEGRGRRTNSDRKARFRVLFLGQVRWTKGIVEIVEASLSCDMAVEINIYGPLLDGVTEEFFSSAERVTYVGSVDNTHVPELLYAHDALLFPSYHEGEGYPGAVIEALQCGVPVIGARWRALPELIEEYNCGLLVEPGDVAGLVDAIRQLRDHPELYTRLQNGARVAGEQFRSRLVYARLETSLRRLV